MLLHWQRKDGGKPPVMAERLVRAARSQGGLKMRVAGLKEEIHQRLQRDFLRGDR